MAAQPITVDQFAAKLKAKYPQYASIPDAQLVEKVVAKYPQYKSQIGGAAPGNPQGPKEEPKPFDDRVIQRLSENAQGMADMPGNVLKDARERYLKRGAGGVGDAAKSMTEGAYYNAVEPTAKGLYGLTPPGIIGRIADKEDPAKLTGDALGLYLPGGEEAGRAFDATRPLKDPTKAGSLWGARSRAQSIMEGVDAAAKDIPVNYKPAYEWAQKAMELGKHGFPVPKPVTDFIQWVDSKTKAGADAIAGKPGSMMDRGAEMNPLPYQVSRNFEQSLGGKIPWDQDPGGRMGGIMKKMRESLGNETATALKPHGLDVPYLKAKADFTKAFGAKDKFGPVGYIGGKLAGYGAGSVTGHPLMMGYAGGKIGQGAAGSIVDSIINAGGEK